MRTVYFFLLMPFLFFTHTTNAFNDGIEKDSVQSSSFSSRTEITPVASDGFLSYASLDYEEISGNGVYFEAFAGFSFVSVTKEREVYNPDTRVWETDHETVNYSGPYVEFKMGNKFYLGDQSENTRVGIDANWGGMGVNMFHDFRFHFLHPGIAYSHAFSEDSGLDINFNGGPVIFISAETRPQLMMRLGPSLKFRYHLLAVGLEFRGAYSVLDEVNAYDAGLVLGFKF